jgi:hypothetical protein
MFTLRSLAFAMIALVLGFFGLSLVFSDTGPGESDARRVVVATFFFFLCGFGLGFFNPKAWAVAGLAAWGAVLVRGLSIPGAVVARDRPLMVFGLAVLFLPLVLTLAGGYAGKLLAGRRAEMARR